MTALLNFIVGGGLLAIMQAALSFWSGWQAKQSGVNEVNSQTAAKVIDHAETAKAIESTVSVSADADVAKQLQQFTRAD